MSDLSLQDLTVGTVEGDGIFDVLMRAVKLHLDAEFKSNRLSGDAYAQVYLGSINAVMQQSVQFALTKDQSAQQAALVKAQIAQTEQQTLGIIQDTANKAAEYNNLVKQGENLDAQIELTLAQKDSIATDVALKEQQVLNLQAEALLIPKQGEKLDADIQVSNAQVLDIAAGTAMKEQQTTNLASEKDNIVKQGDQLTAQTALSTAQTAKVTADTQLTNQQKANLTAEALNIPKQGTLIDAQVTKAGSENTLLAQNYQIALIDETLRSKQVTKADSEISVLDQRVITEKAQTQDVVDGVNISGILGRQATLYQAQADGFSRDAEYKMAKLAADIWSVQRTTDEGISPAGAGFADAELSKIIGKAKQGIGITT